MRSGCDGEPARAVGTWLSKGNHSASASVRPGRVDLCNFAYLFLDAGIFVHAEISWGREGGSDLIGKSGD